MVDGRSLDEIYRQGVTKQDLNERLSFLKDAGVLTEIKVQQADIDRAKVLRRERGIHLSDAVHAVIAIRCSATVVTRNIKHFEKVRDLVELRKPEELL